MMITPHALLGSAIMKKTNSFLLGVPLAIISHFLLDAVPCWDVWFTGFREIMIIISDAMIALFLLFMLTRHCNSRVKRLIWSGAFFGLLVDPLSYFIIYFRLEAFNPIVNLHQVIQKTASIYWSLPLQVALSFSLTLWIRRDRFIRHSISLTKQFCSTLHYYLSGEIHDINKE